MRIKSDHLDHADVRVGTGSARNRRRDGSGAVGVAVDHPQGKGLIDHVKCYDSTQGRLGHIKRDESPVTANV